MTAEIQTFDGSKFVFINIVDLRFSKISL